MNQVYNPGCALLLYKPEYAEKIVDFLRRELGDIALHTICCRHDPKLPTNTKIINTCAGCDKRFSTLYDGITTESLWEILAKRDTFPFPNYNGLKLTVHDACPIRTKSQVHDAIRTLLKKMNIEVIEAPNNRTNSICCGDSFYPEIPLNAVHKMMKKRADTMPCEDVCVYCVSCIKSMHIGGKKPRYILDLLFNQETDPQVYDTVEWHEMLQKFIDEH
ncbi:MAG: (Fe-S)-binding protein [Bacteroidales bacterium]|nr:(Fe-S)-binding protein [Bacteroidales bacterium]